MMKDYFRKLKLLWFHPAEFFEAHFNRADDKEAMRFSVLTSCLVALELGLAEAFSGGSIWIITFVTVLMLIGLPFVVTVWIYLWSAFMKLCANLMGETLPLAPVRQVVAYSVGGLVLLGLGFGLGTFLALAIFVFQVYGFEKVLRYSRWTSVVYVGLPFSMVAVLIGIFTLMFKVFK